jgi:hypothetical protein
MIAATNNTAAPINTANRFHMTAKMYHAPEIHLPQSLIGKLFEHEKGGNRVGLWEPTQIPANFLFVFLAQITRNSSRMITISKISPSPPPP